MRRYNHIVTDKHGTVVAWAKTKEMAERGSDKACRLWESARIKELQQQIVGLLEEEEE